MKKITNRIVPNNLKNQIKTDYSLDKNSWFGIGGKASFFFKPKNNCMNKHAY